MADAEAPSPRTTSSAYAAMAPAWRMVSAILDGVEAMRATSAEYSVYGPPLAVPLLSLLERDNRAGPMSPYLPRFRNETPYDYSRRRMTAPLTNIYADASQNLAGKPFSKTLELGEGATPEMKKLGEDIDGQGNSLHVFAKATFKAGLDKGIDWVLIDYTRVPPGATLADERAIGARPYWVHVSAERMLAVYSMFLGGTEVIFHARIDETVVEQDGYGERTYERVRVIDRVKIVDPVTNKVVSFGDATWQLWELQETEEAGAKKKSWVVIDSGTYTIGIIPLVPFVPAGRAGTSWAVPMPLVGLAHLQVEEFQQESNLKYTKELTAFPMLAGNGIAQAKDEQGAKIEVPVGPSTVLFAPPDNSGNHGEWVFLEPNASSLTFLQADLEKIQTRMRDLGMQPLTSANLTVITTANVAMRAHSAVQAWALLFKDALEMAWYVTGLWLGVKDAKVDVKVHTDFAVEMGDGKDEETLLKAEGQGIYSKETVREELHRRGLTGDDWTEDQEQERLAEQQQGLEEEQQIDPLTGQPVKMDPLTGKPVVMPPSQMPPSQMPQRPIVGKVTVQ